MPLSVFLGDGSVTVAAAGALTGTGAAGTPLAVAVDGSTIDVNGSNQLEVIGGGGLIHQVSIPLSNATIKALPSVFPTVIAAAGVSKLIVCLSWFCSFDITVPYGNVTAGTDPFSSGLKLTYGDDDIDASNYEIFNLMVGATSSALLGGMNGSLSLSGNELIGNRIISAGDVVTNAPVKLVAYNSDGNLSLGDAANTGIVSMAYLVLDVTTGVYE